MVADTGCQSGTGGCFKYLDGKVTGCMGCRAGEVFDSLGLEGGFWARYDAWMNITSRLGSFRMKLTPRHRIQYSSTVQ